MTIVPFQCFDPPPEVSEKEKIAYQNGYRDGFEAGRLSMGQYLVFLSESLRDLGSYKEGLRKVLTNHLVEVFEHVLARLVFPIPLAKEIVQARVADLLDQLDVNTDLNITVSDHHVIKDAMPDFVSVDSDSSLSNTDFRIVWGKTMVSSNQYDMHDRLTAWFKETLEIITNQKEISS